MTKTDTKLYDTIGQFTTIPNSIIELIPTIGGDAFILFTCLRYHTNSKTGTSFPSYTKIHEETTLTRQRIAKALAVLEENNIVTRTRRFSGSTIYTLLIPPISKDGGLMEDEPLVRQVDCISKDGGLPLVTQVDTNYTDINQTDVNQIKESEHGKMFASLASLCKVDIKLTGGQVGSSSKKLLKAGYNLDDLEYFGQWWRENDFRGQKGNPPTIAQVVSMIFQTKQESDRNRKSKNQEPYTVVFNECGEEILYRYYPDGHNERLGLRSEIEAKV